MLCALWTRWLPLRMGCVRPRCFSMKMVRGSRELAAHREQPPPDDLLLLKFNVYIDSEVIPQTVTGVCARVRAGCCYASHNHRCTKSISEEFVPSGPRVRAEFCYAWSIGTCSSPVCAFVFEVMHRGHACLWVAAYRASGYGGAHTCLWMVQHFA